MADEMNTDERAKFEAWYRSTNWPSDLGMHDGRYMSNIADACAGAWQARASLAASAGSEPVAWRAQFDAWWARNRVSTHQVKNIGGFAAKVWHAAIQTVVGATDSTAGFYPADEGSTPSRQATHPSPPEGAGWISVDERLPDLMVDVLAGYWYQDTWIKGKPWVFSYGICRMYEMPDDPCFPQGKRWQTHGCSHSAITHWCVLPAPPASEAKEQ